MNSVFSFLIAFAVSFFCAILLKKLAVKLNILDLPEDRNVHKTATPLLGGVAVYFGLLAGFVINFSQLRSFTPMVVCATALLILGLVDDVEGLSARFRLFCQLLLAGIFIFTSGERVSFLPRGFFGDTAEITITLIWIVGIINAYNYLDGLDGLCAGSVVVNLCCFSVILFIAGQYALFLFCVIAIGACLGFLPHNFSRKKIFLGEAGSTVLGFLVANIGLIGNWAEDNAVKLSIPILILGVPIFDMIFTTIMRVKEKKVNNFLEWLRYGGKDHFHHYLVDLGLHPRGAVIFIYLITLSLGISAVMLSNDRAIEAALTLTQASIIFGVIATLIVVGKRRRNGWF
ncbi:MAG: undecaprenyl/decaprenyl-phosphate alpha-N-acetylglucosaminyl 1-phosphate transferase [Candidatus Omnitrophica bacterium]|nr:undecaprenyl/decaprenyl-phosphate alpha-N-acetylglucosaminyl 1-phosphate transferase [Candidatus Omnitrophota bacterium]